jgi:hypothetical protein
MDRKVAKSCKCAIKGNFLVLLISIVEYQCKLSDSLLPKEKVLVDLWSTCKALSRKPAILKHQ